MRLFRGDRKQCEVMAVQLIEAELKAVLARQEKALLAVPGGRSVSGVFRFLAGPEIDWSRVHLFMVDERLVPLESDESNYKLVRENLLPYVQIPEENLHPFRYQADDPDYGVGEYEEELFLLGKNYDVVLLSSGEDGHVGALYPDHHSYTNEALHFLSMKDSPKPPPMRMTMSRRHLLNAGMALALFFGEGKRDALERYLDDETGAEQCPAKLVKQHKHGFALTDLR